MPGISNLVDSDMEGFIDENSLLSSASESIEPKDTLPAKKSRKRKCVTMPKPKARVAKTSPVTKPKKLAKKVINAKEKAIEDRMDENAFVDAEDEDVVVKPRGRPANKTKPSKKPELESNIAQEDMEVEQTPLMVQSSHAASKPKTVAPKVIKAAKAPLKKRIISEAIEETQMEDVIIQDEVDEIETLSHPQVKAVQARTESRARQESVIRRRAGSASDTERGDPNLRRKLGDITRKFENIDTKFRQLKEVGITEANANVDKLRRQCEATTEASNNLITSLRKELNVSLPLAQDARRLRSELDAQTSEVALLRKANEELTASLISTQNEIKALQAKLAAARKASVEPAATTHNKTPKGPAQSRPTTVGGTNTESVQLVQMKLDLYSDLTGLIVRSVKRSEDGDTYDCIQTGRNGSKCLLFSFTHSCYKGAS